MRITLGGEGGGKGGGGRGEGGRGEGGGGRGDCLECMKLFSNFLMYMLTIYIVLSGWGGRKIFFVWVDIPFPGLKHRYVPQTNVT